MAGIDLAIAWLALAQTKRASPKASPSQCGVVWCQRLSDAISSSVRLFTGDCPASSL